MNDKTIKQNITRLWNQAYINYDDCYAHGLKSEEEKQSDRIFVIMPVVEAENRNTKNRRHSRSGLCGS